MRFERLAIDHFRNLSEVEFELAPGLNTFHGDNGAGKTALLEAVHLLCRGRSFRTQKSQSLIQEGADRLMVRARFKDEIVGSASLAISKDRRSRTELKLNGASERRLSEVARLTPLQVMLPDIADLVFAGPAGRRSWLDWGAFHVKPGYLERLRAYLRAIKQRNALIREGADVALRRPWDEKAAELGDAVTGDRRAYLCELNPHLVFMLGQLAPELQPDLEVRYQQGWPLDESLDKLLGEPRSREVKYGTTLWGPHRADVQLRLRGSTAANVLSRGQGKLVASAMRISQAALLSEKDRRSTVFLIDDAGAELDVTHNERFFGLLRQVGSQVLATTTRNPQTDGPMARLTEQHHVAELTTAAEIRVFHVKHGSVRGE